MVRQNKERSRINMVNINKLRGKIVEKGLNVERVARDMGLTTATLYRRLQAGEQFTIGEAQALCSILDLTTQEATDIFFNGGVA